ncbi:MAG: membrane protein insertase YidC [Atopococcus tabaci]|uniref:Membrane protein insertase YidC n=1 Tax=Atopococcus tabaci TaxID=269774 RepID=A0AA43RNM4_9LACT|nr:membrane protein insertase YidC [Atopococcus tabaci]
MLLTSFMAFTALFLSGCVRLDDAGNPGGWFYNLLVVPTQELISWLAGLMNGNYGWAIVVFTILVRLIILPLSLKQQKAATLQQSKMKAIEPVTKEIQDDLKNAESQEQQMEYQRELQEVYKDVGISLVGGMGCLPLLIQLPIISMVFSALRYSPDMANTTFLGQPLDERSVVFAIIVGIVYLAQAYFMIKGMPEEQKKQMVLTSLMSPIMIFIFSLSTPGGIALYWLVSGIFATFQSLYTSTILKPRLEAQAAEEMGDIDITRKRSPRKEAEKAAPESTPKIANKSKARSSFEKKSSGRNAGKQRRKK